MSYCRPCFAAIVEQNRAKLHGSSRNYRLKRRYGITAEYFDAMSAEQGGLCAICREAPGDQVDHDHDTGRVRGLLCFNCNGALGQFRDRRDLMLRAIAYLDRDPSVPMSALAEFGFGLVLGPTESPRPDDEPRPGEEAA